MLFDEEITIIVQTDSTAPVQAVNGKIGFVTIDKNDVGLSNVENISIITVSGYLQNQINNISGVGVSGDYYPNSNPSGFITGVDLSAYYPRNNPSGFITGVDTSNFYTKDNPSGFITGVDTSSLYPRSNPSGFITGVDTSSLYPRSNPSGFITGVDTSSLYPRSNPSGFITGVDTSSLYPRSNPSGFITGVDTSNFYTKDNPSGFITSQNVIYTSGNQIKSGRLIIGDDAGSIVDPNSQYTLSLQTNSPRTWLEILNYSGVNQGVFFGIEGNDFEQYNWQGGDIKFFTSENVSDGLVRLTIKNDGKVGIGTNSPSEKLEVAGNVKANNLVYNVGDQIISGTKYFNNSVYIHDLYVTGTEFIATVQNNFIESQYILLNLTGGAIDGGIFFVTGTGLTGINDYGPIIGFDHSNKFKFGVARRSDDLSILNDIAAVQDIQNYSGFVNGKYSTIINLESTGSNLNTKIDNLSGYSNNTFATAINLVSTGSSLDTKINNYSGFVNNNFYGINNPSGFITGLNIDFSSYATTGQLAQTSGNLQSQINNLDVNNTIAFAIALG